MVNTNMENTNKTVKILLTTTNSLNMKEKTSLWLKMSNAKT